MTTKEQALENLERALKEYTSLLDKRAPREVVIKPVMKWAAPSQFELGANMFLDCGIAPNAGKIPVVVIPLRREDMSLYAAKFRAHGTAAMKLARIGIKTPSNYYL